MTNSSDILLNRPIMVSFAEMKIKIIINGSFMTRQRNTMDCILIGRMKKHQYTCINGLHIAGIFQSDHQSNVGILQG